MLAGSSPLDKCVSNDAREHPVQKSARSGTDSFSEFRVIHVRMRYEEIPTRLGTMKVEPVVGNLSCAGSRTYQKASRRNWKIDTLKFAISHVE